jgi:type IV pilus assembly protein PilC
VFAVSDWLTSGRGFVWLMATALAVAALWFALRLLPIGIRNWFGDRIGVLIGRSTTIARFAQFVADLLEAELSPPHALRLAGIATNSGPMRRAAWRIAADLEADRPFSPWRSRAILTSTIVRAVQLDVPNASRIRLLSEVSSCYAERARMRLSWTRGIIEPVAIVVIGLLVGATVLALFLPLVTLLNGLA